MPDQACLMFWDKDRWGRDDYLGTVYIPFDPASLWSDAKPRHFDDPRNEASGCFVQSFGVCVCEKVMSTAGACQHFCCQLSLVLRSTFPISDGRCRRKDFQEQLEPSED